MILILDKKSVKNLTVQDFQVAKIFQVSEIFTVQYKTKKWLQTY